MSSLQNYNRMRTDHVCHFAEHFYKIFISSSFQISPADAVLIHYGKVNEGRIEFVKGHDYDITDFAGPVKVENDKVSELGH